jgi:hypothetical protein
MSNPTSTAIQLIVGNVKQSVELRYNEGVKIAAQSPKSALYTANADLKTAADGMGTVNTALKAALDNHHTALAAVELARGALGTATTAWDTAFDVYRTLGAKYCLTEEDAASLALAVKTGGKNPLAPPISVLATYNPKKDWIRVHVDRAPGMDVVSVQMTTDMTNPALWKELDGWGAVHLVSAPAVGTYWFRAASKTAHAVSAFTTPVSVIVV